MTLKELRKIRKDGHKQGILYDHNGFRIDVGDWVVYLTTDNSRVIRHYGIVKKIVANDDNWKPWSITVEKHYSSGYMSKTPINVHLNDPIIFKCGMIMQVPE